jgi:phage tail sheath protein FI
MPTPLTYPGVYIEELPSGVRTIAGVATSIAAFVGRAWRGPIDKPVTLYSYADYERQFGGLWRDSTMSYAVQQFFQNGGGQAIIVRVVTRTVGSEAKAANFKLTNGEIFAAASPGTWGANLKLTVDLATSDPANISLFNLTIFDDPDTKNDAVKRGGSGAREMFRNISVDPASPRFVTTVLAQQSSLLRVVSGLSSPAPPALPKAPAAQVNPAVVASSASDGGAVGANEVTASSNSAAKTGMYALEGADIFNLLCIPPYTPATADNGASTWGDAAAYCKARRAMLLVDAPTAWTPANAVAGLTTLGISATRPNAALYFPRLLMPDPLQDNNLQAFAPCGAVAGMFARTDVARGVWKAPAGTDAGLQGVLGLSINSTPGNLTDQEIGGLNPSGINSIRILPVIGPVVWGARTLDGADVLASQWKYVPVRRLALYLEESLFRGTQWVVFEPNDEPLWSQIRLNVGGFMNTLFRQGAFQGASPKEAYFVKCSHETTTQTDIDNGVVNIIVGFAPLKPAEFVVIKIQQIAGQTES